MFLGMCLAATAAPAGPRFSWDTVPVYYHSCNFTGAYTDAALDVVAKFPMVTIEKGQGVQDASDTRFAEDKIVDTLRRVKQRDANISTIFYYNSILDWPFYRLHADLVARPDLWARDKSGAACHTNGDGSFPNHSNMLSFDFAQAGGRDLWAQACLNVTATGHVDGCFSDRANSFPSCALPDKASFGAGHLQVQQELQRKLGDGVLISNNDAMDGVGAMMLEGFKASDRPMPSRQALRATPHRCVSVCIAPACCRLRRATFCRCSATRPPASSCRRPTDACCTRAAPSSQHALN